MAVPVIFTVKPLRADLAEGRKGGTTVFTFTVARTTSSGTGSVGYRIEHLTTQSDDFVTPTTGTIEFSPGQTSKTLSILVRGDSDWEATEEFRVALENPIGGVIGGDGGASAVGVIRNDDPPTVSISPLQASLPEEQAATATPGYTFVVARENSSGRASVGWRVEHGTTSADDFASPLFGTLTFADGESTRTITVRARSDKVFETDESFLVRLHSPVNLTLGTAAQANGTLVNDDAESVLHITATDAIKVEGDISRTTDMTFTVTRTNPELGARVSWVAESDGITASSDLMAPYTGVLAFLPGESTKTIRLAIKGDSYPEKDEIVNVRLYAPVGASIGTTSASGMIFNDDFESVFSIIGTQAIVLEGDSGFTNLRFDVTRTHPKNVASVDWVREQLPSNTANDLSNAPSGGKLTFFPGETSKTITFNITGDTKVEEDNEFFIRLRNPSNYASIGIDVARGLIINDDHTPALTLTATDAIRPEGDRDSTPLTFTVTRSDTKLSTTVNWRVQLFSNVTASDFVGATSGVLTFKPGQSSLPITLGIRGDTVIEADEVFQVELFNPVGATIETARAHGTILADDVPSILSIEATNTLMREGDCGSTPMTFTVTRTDGKYGAQVSWTLLPSTAEADDLDGPTSGILVFEPGQTRQTITLNVHGDTISEENDEIVVRLHSPIGATMGEPQAWGIILDDDTPSVLNGSIPTDTATSLAISSSLRMQTEFSAPISSLPLILPS